MVKESCKVFDVVSLLQSKEDLKAWAHCGHLILQVSLFRFLCCRFALLISSLNVL